MLRFFRIGVWVLSLLLFSGCGGKPMPDIAPVSGVVRVNGKPLPNLMVRFLPDPQQGNETSFYSTGTTDNQGKYVLEYVFNGEEGQGAAIGWHRVIVADTTFTPPGQQPPPSRVSFAYASPATTPLTFEVKTGEQTIDLDVKK